MALLPKWIWLLLLYFYLSLYFFDNFWALAVALFVGLWILVLLMNLIVKIAEKRMDKEPKVSVNKILQQAEVLETIINELKSKSVNAEIQAVIDRLEEYIGDSKRPGSRVLVDGLYEHILVSSYDKIEKTQDLDLKKEYTVVNHIIKQLIYGKDSHTICENLIRYGDAYEPEKEE